MKPLLRILAGALVAFLALSMAQEWEVFSRSWFQPKREIVLDEASRKGAADAVYLALKLTTHLYGTGGDERFAERIPAASPLVEETLADIRDLASLGIRREPSLVRLEIRDVSPVDPDRALVRTREFWVTRTLTLEGRDAEPARSQVIFATYRVARDGSRWRVDGWDPDDPPAPEEAAAVPAPDPGATTATATVPPR